MNKTFRLRVPGELWRRLNDHLFPGDHDEHGAVIAAGLAQSDAGPVLLARELFIAEEGKQYVPGRHGYRALSAGFVAEKIRHCTTEDLCYLAVHCHAGRGYVAFSQIDLDSHARGYPALLDISGGRPVGALVLAEGAIAGSLWTREGTLELDHCTIVDRKVRRVSAGAGRDSAVLDEQYARQSLMFGARGQALLSRLAVGIVGLGGCGSLINQQLAHLGVGRIIAIDFDRLERSNLPRVVGSTESDLDADDGRGRLKVEIAKRVAEAASPRIRFDAHAEDVREEATARRLVECDFVFLAADGMEPRLAFNAITHHYLIPGAQVGAKVRVNEADGAVEQITVASRLVVPSQTYGCLQCHNWIPSSLLREESLTPEERRRQKYVDGVEIAAPSVISLNSLATAQAVNDFLFLFTGLFAPNHSPGFWQADPQSQLSRLESAHARPDCLFCGTGSRSGFARGDGVRLPCRSESPTQSA